MYKDKNIHNFTPKVEEEVKPEDIDFSGRDVIKETLNQKIWDGDTLRPEVRKAMLNIAREFYDFLKIGVKVKQILFLGSMVNYNWTEQSDLDVHLVFDFSEIDENKEFVEEYMLTKRNLWEEKRHITIHEFSVELYAQDVSAVVNSIGVFNLTNNKWEKIPKKEKLHLDVDLIKSKAAELMSSIDELDNIKDEERKYKLSDKIKEKIRKFRQAGLDKSGEFSTENLAFKIIRNSGYIDKLKEIKSKAEDNMLSIEGTEMIDEIKKNTMKNTLGVAKNLNFDAKKVKIIENFINFVQDKLEINEPVVVYLHAGRNEYIQTTASYLPERNENHIRAGGRALVDILRSIAHEMVHNKQREAGIIQPGQEVQNIGGKIEDQANSVAGVFIKDFAINYGYDNIYDM
jgi:predicted nucleotidyltransferase